MLEDNISQDFNSFQMHTWTFKFRKNSQWIGDLFLSFKLDQGCHTFPKQIAPEIWTSNSLSEMAL